MDPGSATSKNFRAHVPRLALLLLLLASLGVPLVCNGQVFQPQTPFTVHTFVGANESWFEYPEISSAPGSNYSIPALLSKPNLGIALSGGGFRAATLGLGWLRALHALNATGAARFLSSNSGATWLNSAFSFQSKVSEQAFLGPYIPPEQLSMDKLTATDQDKATFAAVIADAGVIVSGALGALVDVVTRQGRAQASIGAWSNAVGRAFLAPYGLNSDNSTFTAAGTAGPVHQALQVVKLEAYKYDPASNRPFPLILGSILLQNSTQGFFPVETTPLYVGCPPAYTTTRPRVGGGFVDPLGFNSPPPVPKPFIPPQILASYTPLNSSMSAANSSSNSPSTGSPNRTARRLKVAACTEGSRKLLQQPQQKNQAAAQPLPGLLQPSAAAAGAAAGSNAASSGSIPEQQQQAGPGQSLNQLLPLPVEVKPLYVVPLKVVAGISSSFLTVMYKPSTPVFRELTGTEVLEYWNQIDFTGGQLPFADGGAADNTAITLLLRRKTRRIVACIASLKSTMNTTAADWAGTEYDVAGLFGAVPPNSSAIKDGRINGVHVEQFNRMLQVFPKEGYQQLFDGLQSSTKAGGPTFHLATYPVLNNTFQAICGGWQTEVLWVVNDVQQKWKQALPKDVQDMLAKSRDMNTQSLVGAVVSRVSDAITRGAGRAELSQYPFIPTGNANYSPIMTGLLNQQAAWQLLQLQPQLQQLLSGGTNATAAPGNGASGP